MSSPRAAAPSRSRKRLPSTWTASVPTPTLGGVMALASEEPFDPFAFERERARAEIVGSGSGIPEGGDESYWDRGQRVIYRGDRKYYRDQLGTEAVYDVSGPPSKQVERPDEMVPDGLRRVRLRP